LTSGQNFLKKATWNPSAPGAVAVFVSQRTTTNSSMEKEIAWWFLFSSFTCCSMRQQSEASGYELWVLRALHLNFSFSRRARKFKKYKFF
jgi:hypothetical protein